MDAQNYKNLCSKVNYFCKILKMREKILGNPQILFCSCFYCTKRRFSQKEPQLKVEIENRREAPLIHILSRIEFAYRDAISYINVLI